MSKHRIPEWQRLFQATRYSFLGLAAAWKNEAAFRLEVILAVFMIPLACLIGRDFLQKILLILPVAIVIIAELVNSAIEAIVDRIGTDYHELSGRAKDIGSAAVFISLLLTALIWLIVLLENYG